VPATHPAELNSRTLGGVRRIVYASSGLGIVLLILVLAQIFLPSIAESDLRSQLGKKGKVLDVSVSAFPAIELLWHDADTVTVNMASYKSSTSDLASLLNQAGGIGTLDASVGTVTTGLLTLHNVMVHKRGDRLSGTATINESDLTSAVPIISNVKPVASSNGQLTFQGTASLLGVSATVDATVQADGNGNLVVAPDVPFGSLATVTVFSDPHVQVTGVSAEPAPGGFTATAQARLR
jgi:hypothetical protein